MDGRILVTGSSGFVGRQLVGALLAQGHAVRGAQRRVAGEEQDGCEYVTLGDFSDNPDWAPVLDGVDCIVHLAARVHVMKETASDPLAAFRRVNVQATLALAQAAADSGVRRFVYLSSIKVNGEQTSGRPFSGSDVVAPVDPYAVSKQEAEQALLALSRDSGMEVVIIRPVLVYGPGVKGNVLRLLQWIDRGWPLPFRGVNNRRSLLALDNLVDLIMLCCRHPRAANRVFLAADGEDLSTEDLARLCARALHRQARLFPVPVSVIRALAKRVSAIGRLEQRLYGSLCVDISQARRLLDWRPPKKPEQALVETGAWYLARQGR